MPVDPEQVAHAVGELVAGGEVVVLSWQTITDWSAAAIAVVTLGLLLKWKIKEPILVGLGAATGLALHWPW